MKSLLTGLIHCTVSARSVSRCRSAHHGTVRRQGGWRVRPVVPTGRTVFDATVQPAPDMEKPPGPLPTQRNPRALDSDNGLVELGGIEPPSNAESPRLLRAQSVQTFCSAPTFVTDT